jgi:threonine dehydratase
MSLTHAHILQAHQRIKSYINQTPILKSDVIDNLFGQKILFKYEGVQKTGSFKARGALNALLKLKEEDKLPDYIVTVSSGNHAQATAYAGQMLGVRVKVFFPPNPIPKKLNNTQALGAETFVAESRKQAEAMVRDEIEQSKAFFLPPFNHKDIICGQGTSCLEALQELQTTKQKLPSAIFATCGGGGWLSGTFLASRGIDSTIKVVGCEPDIANDAYQSYKAGKIISFENAPQTIADGARTLKVGDINFEYLQQLDDFLTATEQEIISARILLEEHLAVDVEPTSAVAFACMKKWLEENKPHNDKPLFVLLSGSNV